MTTNWPDRIYRLLPAVHQIRDGEQGEALRAWLALVGEQVQQLQDDVEQLYDNWFIETCDEWVVPHLGDLVGFRRTGAGGAPADAVDARGRALNRFLYPRREIANLVRRRRRKGTLSVLEDMARDVSGWPARAVEFSRLVNFFQNVKHPQPTMGRTFSFRDAAALPRIHTPFDRTAHTVDVRQIDNQPGRGWYHPRRLGLFVWRRRAFSATRVAPCQKCAGPIPYYTFHRAGIESPLAIRPVPEESELHIADEANLPGPLSRHLLSGKDGRANEAYYGYGAVVPKSLAIFVSWECGQPPELLPAASVRVCGLSPDRLRELSRTLPDKEAAVDPERGILLFACEHPPIVVRVSYHYAAAMETGGGEYERSVIDPPDFRTVRIRANDGCHGAAHLLESARDAWGPARPGTCSTAVRGGEEPLMRRPIAGPPCADECAATWLVRDDFCIELTDSDTFLVPADETLQIAAGKTLVIRAAQQVWPMLFVQPTGANAYPHPWRILLEPGSKLVVDGLLIGGVTIEIADAAAATEPPTSGAPATCRPCDGAADGDSQAPSPDRREIHFRHTTLIPGGGPHASLHSLDLKASQAKLVLRHSVSGPLNIEQAPAAGNCESAKSTACPSDPTTIEITDSLIVAVCDAAIYSGCCPCAPVDLVVERSTVLGDVCVRQMSRAEDSLFAGVVHAQRRGVGYMRFCYVPEDIETAALARIPGLPTGLKTEMLRVWWQANGIAQSLLHSSWSEHGKAERCYLVRTPP